MSVTRRHNAAVLAAILVGGLAGCGADFINQTASFGGPTAGQRGDVQVLFINNTPNRAVFTYATYDPSDPDARPDFGQFGPADENRALDGGTASPIDTLSCARTFSIGEPAVLALIENNLPEAPVVDDALVEGVQFFSIDPAGEADPVPAGAASPYVALLGVDFPCNALLIIRFEIEDAAAVPVRIDFEIIPSESDR